MAYQRVEVISSIGRRRYSDEEKQRLVTEAFQPGVTVVDYARQQGLCPSLLHRWRRQARQRSAAETASVPVPRAGMDRLAALVQMTVRADPFAGDIFVFRSRRADRVKLLVFDNTGLVLITKRLEAGRFVWPPVQDGVVQLSAVQLSVLLAGLPWDRLQSRPVTRPQAGC
jgi:transposase